MKGDDDLLDGSCTYNVSYFSAQPPSAPLRLVPIACTDSQASCTGAGLQGAGVVTSMLHDLITGLPVTPSLKRRTEPHDAFRAVSGSRRASPSVTVTIKSAAPTYSSSSEISEVGVWTSAADLRWVGQVRELRDCHMRLVLRQLRHIVQLNRTVDRAVYSLCRTEKI